MTFWEFAGEHPWLTLAMGVLLLFIVDSIGVDIVRGVWASRGKK